MLTGNMCEFPKRLTIRWRICEHAVIFKMCQIFHRPSLRHMAAFLFSFSRLTRHMLTGNMCKYSKRLETRLMIYEHAAVFKMCQNVHHPIASPYGCCVSIVVVIRANGRLLRQRLQCSSSLPRSSRTSCGDFHSSTASSTSCTLHCTLSPCGLS